MLTKKTTRTDKDQPLTQNDRLAGEKKKLMVRITKRFARHQDDELMMWLKSFSRRHLLDRLDKKDD